MLRFLPSSLSGRVAVAPLCIIYFLTRPNEPPALHAYFFRARMTRVRKYATTDLAYALRVDRCLHHTVPDFDRQRSRCSVTLDHRCHGRRDEFDHLSYWISVLLSMLVLAALYDRERDSYRS